VAFAPRLDPTFDELYEQIRNLPEGVTGEILVPGTLRTMSRPGRRHRRAAKLCEDALRGFDVDRGGIGWWIELEPEIRFPGPRLAVPDLAGWRVERVPELPDENPLTIVPDWCCEVLSPSTEQTDRSVKLPLYARTGVGWIWLVDPDARLVEVYEPRDGLPALCATGKNDETAELPPFGAGISLAGWWPPGPPPADDP
jgi:Uma2 family endonuclease